MPDLEHCRRCGYLIDPTFLNDNGLCVTCDAIESRKNEEGWRDG